MAGALVATAGMMDLPAGGQTSHQQIRGKSHIALMTCALSERPGGPRVYERLGTGCFLCSERLWGLSGGGKLVLNNECFSLKTDLNQM